MQFINWSGALLGPGSEWFWSMLQFAIVAGTLIGLYRQLRIQSSQGAIEQLDRFDQTWTSERFVRYQLDVLIALRDGADPARVGIGAAIVLGNHMENIGALVREGHLQKKLLWNTRGAHCQVWWVWLKPWVREERRNDLSSFENFEWLAGAMAEMDRQAGVTQKWEDDAASVIVAGIARRQDEIRIEQALRTVFLTSSEVVPVVTAAEAQG